MGNAESEPVAPEPQQSVPPSRVAPTTRNLTTVGHESVDLNVEPTEDVLKRLGASRKGFASHKWSADDETPLTMWDSQPKPRHSKRTLAEQPEQPEQPDAEPQPEQEVELDPENDYQPEPTPEPRQFTADAGADGAAPGEAALGETADGGVEESKESKENRVTFEDVAAGMASGEGDSESEDEQVIEMGEKGSAPAPKEEPAPPQKPRTMGWLRTHSRVTDEREDGHDGTSGVMFVFLVDLEELTRAREILIIETVAKASDVDPLRVRITGKEEMMGGVGFKVTVKVTHCDSERDAMARMLAVKCRGTFSEELWGTVEVQADETLLTINKKGRIGNKALLGFREVTGSTPVVLEDKLVRDVTMLTAITGQSERECNAAFLSTDGGFLEALEFLRHGTGSKNIFMHEFEALIKVVSGKDIHVKGWSVVCRFVLPEGDPESELAGHLTEEFEALVDSQIRATGNSHPEFHVTLEASDPMPDGGDGVLASVKFYSRHEEEAGAVIELLTSGVSFDAATFGNVELMEVPEAEPVKASGRTRRSSQLLAQSNSTSGTFLSPEELSRRVAPLLEMYEAQLEFANVEPQIRQLAAERVDARANALRVAATEGRITWVEMLLAVDTFINARDVYTGKTALMCAIEKERAKVVIILLANGADVTLEDNNHRSALFYIARCKRAVMFDVCVTMLKAIVEAGGSFTEKDRFGETAAEVASTHGAVRIASLLRYVGRVGNSKDVEFAGTLPDASLWLSLAEPHHVDASCARFQFVVFHINPRLKPHKANVSLGQVIDFVAAQDERKYGLVSSGKPMMKVRRFHEANYAKADFNPTVRFEQSKQTHHGDEEIQVVPEEQVILRLTDADGKPLATLDFKLCIPNVGKFAGTHKMITNRITANLGAWMLDNPYAEAVEEEARLHAEKAEQQEAQPQLGLGAGTDETKSDAVIEEVFNRKTIDGAQLMAKAKYMLNGLFQPLALGQFVVYRFNSLGEGPEPHGPDGAGALLLGQVLTLSGDPTYEFTETTIWWWQSTTGRAKGAYDSAAKFKGHATRQQGEMIRTTHTVTRKDIAVGLCDASGLPLKELAFQGKIPRTKLKWGGSLGAFVDDAVSEFKSSGASGTRSGAFQAEQFFAPGTSTAASYIEPFKLTGPLQPLAVSQVVMFKTADGTALGQVGEMKCDSTYHSSLMNLTEVPGGATHSVPRSLVFVAFTDANGLPITTVGEDEQPPQVEFADGESLESKSAAAMKNSYRAPLRSGLFAKNSFFAPETSLVHHYQPTLLGPLQPLAVGQLVVVRQPEDMPAPVHPDAWQQAQEVKQAKQKREQELKQAAEREEENAKAEETKEEAKQEVPVEAAAPAGPVAEDHRAQPEVVEGMMPVGRGSYSKRRQMSVSGSVWIVATSAEHSAVQFAAPQMSYKKRKSTAQPAAVPSKAAEGEGGVEGGPASAEDGPAPETSVVVSEGPATVVLAQVVRLSGDSTEAGSTVTVKVLLEMAPPGSSGQFAFDKVYTQELREEEYDLARPEVFVGLHEPAPLGKPMTSVDHNGLLPHRSLRGGVDLVAEHEGTLAACAEAGSAVPRQGMFLPKTFYACGPNLATFYQREA